MRTSDDVLVKSLFILATDILSDDGVANAAIHEAALRMEELIKMVEVQQKHIEELKSIIQKHEQQ